VNQKKLNFFLVSKMIKKKEIVVIDMDEIARKVVKKDSYAYRKIVNKFGREILKEDLEINREELGRIVFSDEKQRKLLNSITHFPILLEMFKNLVLHFLKGTPIVVIGT
jgi:dephospho-CoA kinase